MPRQTRRSRRTAPRRAASQPSVPFQSDPVVGVPGLTGDVVADEPDLAFEPEPAEQETRFRSRYMAEKTRDTVAPAPVRRRTPDHRYVVGEIKRILLTAALMMVILVVATLLLR
jgi:hypothetical protein